MLVLLDNGHGKDTPGKRSPLWPDGKQMFEWEFNRDIVSRIADQLKHLDIAFKLIAPGTQDLPIGFRVRQVNDAFLRAKKKAFLVSVHANASKIPNTGTGWEAFVSLNASAASHGLGKIFYEEAQTIFGGRGWNIRTSGNSKDPVKKMNFQLLRDTLCPAILTENFFMDNRRDFDFMNSEEGRLEIADMHVRAIYKFIHR